MKGQSGQPCIILGIIVIIIIIMKHREAETKSMGPNYETIPIGYLMNDNGGITSESRCQKIGSKTTRNGFSFLAQDWFIKLEGLMS